MVAIAVRATMNGPKKTGPIGRMVLRLMANNTIITSKTTSLEKLCHGVKWRKSPKHPQSVTLLNHAE